MKNDSQFDLLSKSILDLVNNHIEHFQPIDYDYIIDWLESIRLAYNMDYFELPIETRKNVSWNEYSFVRSGWGDALIGFRSEVIAIINNMKFSVLPCICKLIPDDKNLQLSGTDIIMQYTGNNKYDVSIQVKTGKFTSTSKLISIDPSWLKYTKTHKYHRINIVDKLLRAIIKSDYDDFIKSCYKTNKGWILDVNILINQVRSNSNKKLNTISALHF